MVIVYFSWPIACCLFGGAPWEAWFLLLPCWVPIALAGLFSVCQIVFGVLQEFVEFGRNSCGSRTADGPESCIDGWRNNPCYSVSQTLQQTQLGKERRERLFGPDEPDAED